MNAIEKEIRNYLGGISDETESKRLERLIDEDPAYRAAFEMIIRADDDLGEMVFPRPSAGLKERIMDQYEAVMPQPVTYQESKAEQQLEKIFSSFLVAAPAMMFLVYLFFSVFSGPSVSLRGLAEGLKSSWIVWTLILLNVVFVIRLITIRSDLKNDHQL